MQWKGPLSSISSDSVFALVERYSPPSIPVTTTSDPSTYCSPTRVISENGPNSERSHLIRNRPVSTVTPLSSSLTRNGFSYVPRLTADPYSNVYSASDDTGTSAWKSTSTHFTVPSRHRPSVRVCNATSLPDWSSKRIVRDEPRTPCGKGTPD